MSNEITVCRCEEVTQEEIKEAVQEGFDTINAVKKRTRAGMGLCQGRTCCKLIAQILAANTEKKLEELLPPTNRPPVRPIKLGQLGEGSQCR